MLPIQKKIFLSGAWLLAVGFATGLWAAMALTGKVVVPIPHLALAAHVSSLLGGIWLIAVAATFPHLGYDTQGLRRLGLFIQIPTWSNWVLTLIASFIGVRGIEYNGNRANDAIALLLQVFVVVPSFIGVAFWIRGFYVHPSQAQSQQGDR